MYHATGFTRISDFRCILKTVSKMIADNGHVTVCKLQQVLLNFARLVSSQLTCKRTTYLFESCYQNSLIRDSSIGTTHVEIILGNIQLINIVPVPKNSFSQTNMTGHSLLTAIKPPGHAPHYTMQHKLFPIKEYFFENA